MRVRRAAAELGYRPNSIARGLKTRDSRLVGLILHNLINVSFHTIAEIAQTRMALAGYQVILCISGDDSAAEANYLEMLADHQVQGLLVVSTGRNAERLIRLQREGIPVVELIRRTSSTLVDAVLAGDVDGSYQATNYLLSLGHRRIGLVAGPADTTSGRERRLGYTRSMTEAGLPVDGDLIVEGAYLPETGSRAVAHLLGVGTPPTALLIANHESVFGALPALAERGLRIPDDLSVLCYEDVPWFRWWHPPISVVDSAAGELADLGASLLLDRIRAGPEEGKSRPAREYRVGARLVLRESCAPPSRRQSAG